MSSLLVTSRTPTLGSGTGLRTFGVTAALARHEAVEVAYVVFGGDRPAEPYERHPNVTLRPLLATRGPARALRFARARAGGVPADLARGVSPALARAARNAAPGTRVIADGPVVAAALLPAARTTNLVYLAHNLESGGFRGESGRKALTRFERMVLRAYAESWMATHADIREAQALAGEPLRARYVPNVIDVDEIVPVTPAGQGRVVFVADYTYAPNLEALRFLLDRVLPRAWELMPDLRLTAVGRGFPGPAPDRRVEVAGFVADLSSVYRTADVVVVPLLRGGGSPLKFLEGLAYGLPVVATPHAAGLVETGVRDRHFLVADDAAAFAAAIELLIRDRDRAVALGRGGRDLVEREYSTDALARLLAMGA